jgi:hypothetical protein
VLAEVTASLSPEQNTVPAAASTHEDALIVDATTGAAWVYTSSSSPGRPGSVPMLRVAQSVFSVPFSESGDSIIVRLPPCGQVSSIMPDLPVTRP